MASILITGASSGIGKKLAERAVDSGETVFATVRKQSDLDALGDHKNLHCILMDVGDEDSVAAGFLLIDKYLEGQPLDIVVNCAAVSPFGAVELLPLNQFELALNTNLMGSIRIAKMALPRLRGHGGRIIFVTSLWGKVAGPMLSAYTTTKFAIEAFADSIRRETVGMNMHVIVAEPGVVQTRMLWEQARQTREAAEQLPAADAAIYGPLYNAYAKMVEKGSRSGITDEQCAQAIEKAMYGSRPKRRYRIGLDAKLVILMGRLFPDAWLDFVFRKMLKLT